MAHFLAHASEPADPPDPTRPDAHAPAGVAGRQLRWVRLWRRYQFRQVCRVMAGGPTSTLCMSSLKPHAYLRPSRPSRPRRGYNDL
jgi:hypothetical protein